MKLQILAIATLLMGTVSAQGPPMRGNPVQMRVEQLTRMLELTNEQKAKATTIYTDAQSAGESARTSLQSTNQSLDEAVKANNIGSIDQLSVTSGTLSGQLTAFQRKADAAFYQILTAEQKEKYDAMPRGFGAGGPGPFGGRRGPAER